MEHQIRLFVSLLLVSLFLFSCKEDDDVITPDPKPEPTEIFYRDGITRISDDSLAFVLFAPGKNS
ncbi:hypothetical protein LJB91_03110, partial [Bacteroidales bacterium OttesenSCG-928-L03]|nr:hypothetical protein [Bacteroidales bacterium OttesenSCG-928-L03]